MSQLKTQNLKLGTLQGRLQSLLQGKDGLGITVPEDLLPPFLLEANALVRSGLTEQAKALLSDANIRVIEHRVASDPSLTDLMYILARLLADTGQYEAAERWYRRVLAAESHPLVWADLAKVCARGPYRLGEVLGCWEGAYRLDPDNPAFKAAYADSLMEFGRVSEGTALLQQVLQQTPDRPDLPLSWLWNLHYLPGPDRAFFFDQYTRVGRHYGPSTEIHGTSPCTRPLDPDLRLRVGIVSGDFKTNTPGSNYESFLELCDRDRFELLGYGNVENPDDATGRVRSLVDVYRDIYGCPDEQVAEQIRQDGIDILVEIGGYCGGNRLGVFLLRPAPVQVDLGWIDTLGLPQVGYRITDEMLDPPDTQRFFMERLVYLPGGLVPYRPPGESPLVGPLPATINGYLTFGSFNNLRKINDLVLSLWGQVLRRIPDAHMVLKFPAANDPAIRDDVKQRFQRLGIDPGRVRLCGTTSHFDHLSLLEQVDVLLDCFPFNGYRTTVEGLWMGVPTITLAGSTFVAQMGRAILARLGLEAFVASTPGEYVAKACAFASQRDALGLIRGALRERLLSSCLCDPSRFTRELEQALRWIWSDFCASQNPEAIR